jgi:aldose 1-epimerase
MSFEISQIRQEELDITEIKNTDNSSRIQVLPSVGALWHGWWVNQGKDNINLINHYRNGADLKENLRDSHKSVKLSPFACRIPHGKYTYDGREYEFTRKFSDGSAIHGLLVDKPFEQGEVRQGDDHASVSFYYAYRHEDAGYPFDYDCIVTYTLHKNGGVTLETRIKNLSEEAIPIVDGWHPYFTTGSLVNDCNLQFNADRVVEFDEKLIPTGRLLPYNTFRQEQNIGETELDHSFMLDMNSPQPRCTFHDPEKNIRLHVYPSENYPILQLYIPPDRRSIAIETLSGAPDAFNNGIGLILLSPKESKTFSVTFEAETGL